MAKYLSEPTKLAVRQWGNFSPERLGPDLAVDDAEYQKFIDALKPTALANPAVHYLYLREKAANSWKQRSWIPYVVHNLHAVAKLPWILFSTQTASKDFYPWGSLDDLSECGTVRMIPTDILQKAKGILTN